MSLKVPTIPVGKIANEDGTMSQEMADFITQLLLYVNNNLGVEGHVMPPVAGAGAPINNIALLTNSLDGTIVYDSFNDEFMGKKNGTFLTFTLT